MSIDNLKRAAGLLSLFLLLPAGAARAADGPCIWDGTAPLCNGDCKPGYTLVKRDKQGPAGAKKCATGTKARCCLTSDIRVVGKAPLCNGKCPVGEETLGQSEYGEDGNKCATGHAAICRLAVK